MRGVAIALLALGFCLGAPAATHATVFNVVVADGNQDPTDDLPDNDYLWAYTTADIASGIVCVHPAPVQPGDHCDDKGTWGESPVPPATATFTPISAPPLPPGRWQILAANDADDPEDDATSVEFTVTPCVGDCPLEIGPERKADFERAREVVLESVKAVCTGLNAVGIYQALRAAQFETEMVLAFPGGAGGTFAVTWGRAVEGAGIVVRTSARLVGPTKLGKNAYLDWAAWFACQAYDLAKKLAGQGDSRSRTADSPKARRDATPAYEVLPSAEFPTLPSLDEPPVDNLGVHLAGIEGNMDAVEVGWDRMVAAREASADDWEHAQARAVGAAGLELTRHLRRAVASLRGFADVAAADPDIPDPLVTQQDIDEAEDVRARVRASGLTPDEIADLKAQGGTDADVEALKTIVGRDVSDAPIGRSLPDLIRDEAQSYEDLIAPADALGREAAAVAGRTNHAPHAAFSITGVSGPAPQPATFTDESDDPDHDPLTVTWDFGDGTFGAGSKPSHTYLADGKYTVTQTVSDGYTTDTATKTVTVGEPNQPPTAAFTATPASGDAPLDVSFDATSSSDLDGQVTAYNWDFGEGGTGSGATISHTYSSPGTYTATLTVTDDDGATATSTRTIDVAAPNAPPAASFTATPTSGTVPLNVGFDATGSIDGDGSIVAYAWTFGDGNAAIGSAPSHTYTAAGTYTVTLTVTDDDGATAASTSTITATDPENVAPTASFTATPDSGTAPLEVAFDAGASADSDGGVSSYEWSFGDGNAASGVAPSHTFTTAGTYTVTLTVTDDDGATDTAQTTIGVAAAGNTAPTAVLSAVPSSGDAPLDVTFDASGSSDPEGDIASATLDFGDGASAGTGSTLHTYTTPGTYTATLTVTDDEGATDTTTQTIKVTKANQKPHAEFTADPVSGDSPLNVSFDASGSTDEAGIVLYEWDFGDGATGSGLTAAYVYRKGGSFMATLRVTDTDGATDEATRRIDVTVASHAPEPVDDTLAAEGAGAVDVLANDSDPDNDALRVVATGAPAHGTASCAALGGCLYTPAAGYAGPDSFTYRVADTGGLEATGKVSVDVTTAAASSTFVPRADHAATRQGTAVTVHVLANDTGTGLHVTHATQPPHGAVACEDDGTCVYTPAAGYSGDDGFSYTVANADGEERSADVGIAIAPSAAGYGVTVRGAPAAAGKAGLAQGQGASWGAAVAPAPSGVSDEALGALPLPAVTAELDGAHALKPSSVRTARGWTAEPVTTGARTLHAKAGSDALLGEVSDAIPRPLPAIGQGTGGDGHVPILVGSKVFAFFHHSSPTQVTCVDRATGSLCPGYPKTLNQATTNIPGPAVVVGSRIYVHLAPTQFAAQRTAHALYCWDAAKDRTCGLIVVDRLDHQYAYASAPVLIGDKVYFGGDGGRLYCVDPATNAPCAVASLPTGLGPDASEYDIVGHGSRVYLARLYGLTACIDVTAGGPCPGWALPRQLGGPNLVTHHSAAGAADGVCSIGQGAGQCYTDANPDAAIPITGWPGTEDYYSVTAEAEIGKRTLMAAHGHGGLGCWDWTTMAPCTGGDYVDGWIDHDTQAGSLPMAYGAAYDGSCVVGLGDPGLIFTVDPAGHAPCTSLGAGTEPRTIDLRDQRCDNTVGAATWHEVALADSAPGELAAVTVTVRDAATGALLATKDITGSKLDLSGIDPKAHPAITVAANAISTSGDPAWADSVPPRIRVAWKADPRQLCFETTTQVECTSPLAPIGVTASIDGSAAKDEETLDLVRGACPPELPALPDRSAPEQTPLDATVTASDPNGGPLKYSLLKAPPGMTIDAASGHLAWTPTEAQGPGSYEVTVKVADPGGLADQGTFTVKATEVNRPPVLAPLPDATVGTGKAFAARAVASDPDLPANHLGYTLVAPPAGASIDRASGAIAWPAVPSGAHPLTVRVTDDGSPSLSAERAFTVTGGGGGTLGNTQQSSAADLVRACTSRGVVLEDVIPAGNRVKLLGVAEERFKGRRVDIVFAATGKIVARPKVGADGSFSATAPMPPRRLRFSNRARYQARVGGERSLNLKLMRRMLVTSVRTSAGKVTIAGRVIGPLALRAKDREIVLERRVTCTRLATVSRFKPRSNGAFKVTVPVPAGTSAAVYRLRTKVRASTHGSRLSSTFTLPRAIGFR